MADCESWSWNAWSISVITYCGRKKGKSAQRIMMPSPKGSGASLKRISLAKSGKTCASKRKMRVMDYTTLNKKEWVHSNTKKEEERGCFLREEC